MSNRSTEFATKDMLASFVKLCFMGTTAFGCGFAIDHFLNGKYPFGVAGFCLILIIVIDGSLDSLWKNGLRIVKTGDPHNLIRRQRAKVYLFMFITAGTTFGGFYAVKENVKNSSMDVEQQVNLYNINDERKEKNKQDIRDLIEQTREDISKAEQSKEEFIEAQRQEYKDLIASGDIYSSKYNRGRYFRIRAVREELKTKEAKIETLEAELIDHNKTLKEITEDKSGEDLVANIIRDDKTNKLNRSGFLMQVVTTLDIILLLAMIFLFEGQIEILTVNPDIDLPYNFWDHLSGFFHSVIESFLKGSFGIATPLFSLVGTFLLKLGKSIEKKNEDLLEKIEPETTSKVSTKKKKEVDKQNVLEKWQQRAIVLKKQGKSLRSIGESVGKSRTTVKNFLNSNGIETKQK